MQAHVDWVLIIFGTQVIKKKRPVRPVFPDYLSVSYDYDLFNKTIKDKILNYIPYETVNCDDRDPPRINKYIKELIYKKNQA